MHQLEAINRNERLKCDRILLMNMEKMYEDASNYWYPNNEMGNAGTRRNKR